MNLQPIFYWSLFCSNIYAQFLYFSFCFFLHSPSMYSVFSTFVPSSSCFQFATLTQRSSYPLFAVGLLFYKGITPFYCKLGIEKTHYNTSFWNWKYSLQNSILALKKLIIKQIFPFILCSILHFLSYNGSYPLHITMLHCCYIKYPWKRGKVREAQLFGPDQSSVPPSPSS